MAAKTNILGADGTKAKVTSKGELVTLPTDFHHEMASGTVEGHRVVHKFGRATVGTTFVPLCLGNVWPTPQVAVQLRIKAGGNVADIAGGAGAREVFLQGVDARGMEVADVIPTNGANASVATVKSFLRFYRGWVAEAGTYATISAGSHVADIVIEDSGGVEDWGTIDSTGFPRSQSEIGCYTVPSNERAFINTITVYVDATKSSDFIFFQRQNILQTAAPYSAMREVIAATGITGQTTLQPESPVGGFPPLTDLIFLGKVGASTGEIIVDFEITLEAVGI